MRPLAFWTGEAFRNEVLCFARVPCVGGLPFEDRRDVIDEPGVGDRASAVITVESRYGNAPHPLTRDTPIRTPREHVTHSVTAPGGYPVYRLDFLERRLS